MWRPFCCCVQRHPGYATPLHSFLCAGRTADVFVFVFVFVRPFWQGLYVQQIGRGLRSFPGKASCIVLDHAGNTWYVIHLRVSTPAPPPSLTMVYGVWCVWYVPSPALFFLVAGRRHGPVSAAFPSFALETFHGRPGLHDRTNKHPHNKAKPAGSKQQPKRVRCLGCGWSGLGCCVRARDSLCLTWLGGCTHAHRTYNHTAAPILLLSSQRRMRCPFTLVLQAVPRLPQATSSPRHTHTAPPSALRVSWRGSKRCFGWCKREFVVR